MSSTKSFQSEVKDRGHVDSWDLMAKDGKTLGDLVCEGMRPPIGNGADIEANALAEQTKPDGSPKFSLAQSRVIVYWAITDLCPDQISKPNDDWVNITRANA